MTIAKHIKPNMHKIFYNLDNIQEKEIIPGYKGKFVHSQNMTIAYWDIKAGYLIPEHSHPHEQVATITAGKFELTVNGETRVLGIGDVAVIPPNAKHSGKALTHCRIIDVFYPMREDYR